MSAVEFVLVLGAVGLAAFGQLLLKNGMVRARHQADAGHSLAAAAVSTPTVWFGLAVFGVSAVVWLYALSRVPLSIAYPFNALGYLGVLALSAFVLHEHVRMLTWLGSLLVVAGLIVVVLSQPQ